MTFQQLQTEAVDLTAQTKAALLENVQRQFQQKALEGSDYLLIYLRNLKTIMLSPHFKQAIFEVNTVQIISVYLSALFF